MPDRTRTLDSAAQKALLHDVLSIFRGPGQPESETEQREMMLIEQLQERAFPTVPRRAD